MLICKDGSEFKYTCAAIQSKARYVGETFEQDSQDLPVGQVPVLQQAVDTNDDQWGTWIEEGETPVNLSASTVEGWPLSAYKEAVDNRAYLPTIPGE